MLRINFVNPAFIYAITFRFFRHSLSLANQSSRLLVDYVGTEHFAVSIRFNFFFLKYLFLFFENIDNNKKIQLVPPTETPIL